MSFRHILQLYTAIGIFGLAFWYEFLTLEHFPEWINHLPCLDIVSSSNHSQGQCGKGQGFPISSWSTAHFQLSPGLPGEGKIFFKNMILK